MKIRGILFIGGDCMKKSMIIFSVFLVLFIGSIDENTYGASVNKDHWVKKSINRSLIDEYFKPLDRMDYKRIDFDKNISTYMLESAYKKLFNKYGMDYRLDTSSMHISRMDFVNTIYSNLQDNGFKMEKVSSVKFKDVADGESMGVLSDMHRLNIISGNNDSSFRPNDNISQAEAFIILDRTEKLLSSVENISYEIMENNKVDFQPEYLNMRKLKGNYVIELVKTYNVESSLDLVQVNQVKHNINLIFNETKEGPLVEKYSRKVKILVDGNELKGPGPFNFRVKGMDFPSSL